MQAMILAAGRGERMNNLTKNTPKPLLKVAGKSLIEYNIDNLHKAKINKIIINTNYLGEKIIQHLQDYDDIIFTRENNILESAGGIINAFDKLDEIFIVVNSDVLTDYDLSTLKLPTDSLAHLVLVDNPPHNINGDFTFNSQKLTFSGIGIYHKKLFKNYNGYCKLGDVLRNNLNAISFEKHCDFWIDVGTKERLVEANNIYGEKNV